VQETHLPLTLQQSMDERFIQDGLCVVLTFGPAHNLRGALSFASQLVRLLQGECQVSQCLLLNPWGYHGFQLHIAGQHPIYEAVE
jgi:hypothetical protein